MITSEEKERKTRNCIMPTCVGQRFDLVHKFPREDDRTIEWLKAVDLSYLYDVPYSKLRSAYFICSRHFRKKDYKNALSRHLNKTAVPCINLKTLDMLEDSLDSSVPRVANILAVQQSQSPPPLIIDKPGIAPSSRSADEDDDELTLHNVKSKKSNFGQRISSFIEDNRDVEIIRKCPASGRNDENVRFFLNVIDPKPHNEAQIEYSWDGSNVIDDQNEENDDGEQDESAVNVVVYEECSSERTSKVEDALEDECESVHQDVVLQKSPVNKEMPADLLEVTHPDYSETLKLDYIWLRDHCRCKECYNQDTHQRKLDILDISLDVKPVQTEVGNDGVWVKWNDGHESRYDIKFLYKSQYEYTHLSSPCEQVLWDQEIVHQLDYSRVNFNSYLSDEQAAKSVVKSLVEFGFAFVEKVPPNKIMTETVIKRLFPIQKTFFGDMWTFTDEKDHCDTAYTNESLGLHTDNTYWNDAAGLQAFHCIKHSGSGGETILTDGFKVINDFEIKDPKAYNQLTSINVPGEYIENDTHYTFNAPIICLDAVSQRPEQIRYNIYDRAAFNTIPQAEMRTFYKSLQSLAEEVNRDENHWRFKLNPGTVLIFDNWRVLHGREKYTGKREMTGCYVARSEFLSAARIMGLVS